jgi:hypothetical protein
MIWPWRVIIIVPASSRAAANAFAAQIDWGNTDGSEAFGVPLSSNGLTPPTHYAAYTSATDDMVSAMSAALPQVAGVKYWRHDVQGLLVASNVTQPSGQTWGWAESLAAAGLVVVQPQMP